MADDGAILLSPETYDRFDEAAGQVLGTGRAPRQRRLASGLTQGTFHARCTSGTADGDGFYDAVVAAYDVGATAWIDHGAIKVFVPNTGHALLQDWIYEVRPIGETAGGHALYAWVADYSDAEANVQGIVGVSNTQYMGQGSKYFVATLAPGLPAVIGSQVIVGPIDSDYTGLTGIIAGLNPGPGINIQGSLTDVPNTPIMGFQTFSSTKRAAIAVSEGGVGSEGSWLWLDFNQTDHTIYVRRSNAISGVTQSASFVAPSIGIGSPSSSSTVVSGSTGFATTQKFGAPR